LIGKEKKKEKRINRPYEKNGEKLAPKPLISSML